MNTKELTTGGASILLKLLMESKESPWTPSSLPGEKKTLVLMKVKSSIHSTVPTGMVTMFSTMMSSQHFITKWNREAKRKEETKEVLTTGGADLLTRMRLLHSWTSKDSEWE